MAKLLEYLNTLDQNADAREEHNKNPVKAMTDFGLCKEEQAAFLSGDKDRIARYVGINSTGLPSIIVNVVTY